MSKSKNPILAPMLGMYYVCDTPPCLVLAHDAGAVKLPASIVLTGGATSSIETVVETASTVLGDKICSQVPDIKTVVFFSPPTLTTKIEPQLGNPNVQATRVAVVLSDEKDTVKKHLIAGLSSWHALLAEETACSARSAAESLSRVRNVISQMQTRCYSLDDGELSSALNTFMFDIATYLQCDRYYLFLSQDPTNGVFAPLVKPKTSQTVPASPLYRLGEGLTGKCVEAKSPLTLTVSHSLLHDPRRSAKYESMQLGGHVSFLGVNFSYFSRQSRSMQSGAITFLRESQNLPQLFTIEECKEIQLAASVVASSISQCYLHLEHEHDKQILERLRALWTGPAPVVSRIPQALELLHERFPLQRSLIASVDHNAALITGLGVSGFDRSLVEETRRLFYTQPPDETRKGVEDILSASFRLGEYQECCDENRDGVLVLSRIIPCQMDIMNRQLDEKTSHREALGGKILVAPIWNGAGEPVAVILSEFSSETAGLSPLQSASLRSSLNLIGAFVSADRIESLRKNLRLPVEASLGRIGDLGGSSGNDEAAVTQYLTTLCDLFGYKRSCFFRYDTMSNTLQMAAGTGISAESMTTRVIPITNGYLSSSTPVAEAVFRQRNSAFLFSPASAKSTSLPFKQYRDESVYIVSLSIGDECRGVLIATTTSYSSFMRLEPALVPNIQVPQYLQDACHTLAKLDTIVANLRTIAVLSAKREAIAVILRLATRISRHEVNTPALNKTNSKPWEHPELTTVFSEMARSIAELFSANISGVFLLPDPLVVETGSVPLNHLMNKAHNISQKLVLRGGYSFKSDRIGVYSYLLSETSLTTFVLQQGKPHREADVRKTMLSSGRQQKEDCFVEGTFRIASSPRSWMGIPIAFKGADHDVYFGTLTIARERESCTDSKAFTSAEMATGTDLARTLALALEHSRSRVFSNKKLMNWLTHQMPGIVSNIHDVHVHRCRKELDQIVSIMPDQEPHLSQLRAGLARIESLSLFLSQSFANYRAFAVRDRVGFSYQSVLISDLIERAKELAKELVHSSVDITWSNSTGAQELTIDTDVPKVIHSLVNILINAGRQALKGKRRKETAPIVRMTHGVEGGSFFVEIWDNGDGFSERDREAMFLEGHSAHGSSGLGLPIVRYLIEDSNGGTISAKNTDESFTVFRLTLFPNGGQNGSNSDC